MNSRQIRRCKAVQRESLVGGAIGMVVGIFTLPLFGLHFLAKGNADDKLVGIVMVVAGVFFWNMMA